MKQIGYLEEDESTWVFQKLPDIDRAFSAELTRLGGLNPLGKPNLIVVKGNEVMNDRAENPVLKYLLGYSPPTVLGLEWTLDGEKGFSETVEEVPETAFVTKTRIDRVPLGRLNYVIEKWTSPAELEAQNRFQTRKSADGEVLLREFPREGIYETYFIVRSEAGGFRALDKAVLDFIRFKWQYEQLPEAERESFFYQSEAAQEAKKKAEYRERIQACLDGDLRLPKEETERRERFWANYDYAEERMRGIV